MIYMQIFKTDQMTDTRRVNSVSKSCKLELSDFIEKYPYMILYTDSVNDITSVSYYDILWFNAPHLVEKMEWAEENLHEVVKLSCWFGFTNRDDALAFKMRWS